MIARVWHGWTTLDNADSYETLLREEIFPGIAAKGVAGYLGIELHRRELSDGEVEFVTTMWFESLDDVRAFAGEDYETAYVPDAARAVLNRFDPTSAHYEVRVPRSR
jgi:heme-degrading monooxygenase HmoA